ncbi:hypothetical protein Q5741_18715 [Paenibacillus sp. JX-17]|uniref:Uncharacterized protein n=1 Tax=Paenibacillus lacisoli TaxID=3064525 RepID=A0ABT9CGQ8_9BACL|nr:hypothetical protein [Paenibacillus sp. JX-17]MDO7908437.1 hypothetical protein [Paenibacillus sp. JX-17]
MLEIDIKDHHVNEGEEVFQIRLRDTKDFRMLDFGHLGTLNLFPCKIYFDKDYKKPVTKREEIKERLLSEDVIYVDYRGLRGELRRLEVSHVDGPFKVDLKSAYSIERAAVSWEISESTIRRFLRDKNATQVTKYTMQHRFGALGSVPKKDRHLVSTMIRNYRFDGFERRDELK